MKYEQEASQIIDAVGGKENVSNAFHCFTRLRIEVRDPDKVDVDALGKVNKVMKVVKVGKQFQAVIGPDVNDVYEAFCEIGGFERHAEVDPDSQDAAAADAPGKKAKLTPKGIFDAVIDAISGCIQPLLVGIICAGMIKMVVSIIGPGMLGLVTEDSNLYTILNMAGDVPFYFLPVMLGYTGAKKFGMSPVTGMILGGILVHPTLVQIVATGEPFDVYGIPMSLVTYSSSVVPMILTTWVASYVERFFNRHIPNMIKMMAVAPLTILVMLPLELCILAPLGNNIGAALSGFFLALPTVLGPLGIGIIAAIYIVLVMTGMHLPVIMAVAVTYFTNGFETTILPAGAMATTAVAGVCLGFLLKAKQKQNKELGLSCFTANMLGGVSEPAIFGILLEFKRTFLYQAIGAFCGGLVIGLGNVGVYTITSGATVIAPLGFLGGPTSNFLWGVAGMTISFVVPLVLSLVLGVGENEAKQENLELA